jgi:hypothetical protein
MLESNLLTVAQMFAREVNKLETLKEGTGAYIEMSVQAASRYETEKQPKIKLSCSFFDGRNHATVEAASLGALMDEVHRRCGFSDKQSLAIDANNRALTALEDQRGKIIDLEDL